MKTDVTLVLDRSGSMLSIRDDVIGSFNQFIEDQNKNGDGIEFRLYQFNENLNKIDMQKLDESNYKPQGTTALIDAVCAIIDETGHRLSEMNVDDRPDKVLIVVITDGLENSSHKFNSDDLKNKIQHQTDVYKWDFVYLAANQDAFTVGGNYGFVTTANFTASGEGTRALATSLSNNVKSYRSTSGRFEWKDN